MLDGLKSHDGAKLVKLVDVVDRDRVALVGDGFEVHRLVVDAEHRRVVVERDGEDVVELAVNEMALKSKKKFKKLNFIFRLNLPPWMMLGTLF